MNNIDLKQYLDTLLAIDDFADYCPNGLQVQGKTSVNNVITGVSSNLALIEKAINLNADAILVHHGFFWKNEPVQLIGAKRQKIALLLKHNINLYAYHLPLDAHIKFGNNITLGYKLDIKNPTPVANSLLWQGMLKISLTEFEQKINKTLARKPLIVGAKKDKINSIAWCSGGAQNMINEAINLNVDAYLSGEISEQTPYIALENNIAYISAGHHATERYGVQALGQHLSEKFTLSHQFIDIDNIV